MPKQRATGVSPSEAESTTPNIAGQGVSPGTSSTPESDSTTHLTTPQPERAGTDARQRGWYWHWNGIVTQYAPLIGLKGVGLLNSYTVWTDRREASPTRGYAFPGQQAEADFYGEDRAELITINKILVALDLIEIRKEMVRRTDAQGRNWKVPRNLYRVKDRPEGIELRTADVLRVAELASRDPAVFRYVRRVFSSRFQPIDRDNVWHRILAEVADNPTWQELTDKTARIEARASARTRAGHKSRSKQSAAAGSKNDAPDQMTNGHSSGGAFGIDEQIEVHTHGAATTVARDNNGSAPHKTSVARTNSGSEADVDTINRGSQGGDTSSAEATNNGSESVVAPGNATYYQETSTTTTTTTGAGDSAPDRNDTTSRAGRASEAPRPPAGSQGSPVAGASAEPSGLDDDPAALYAGDRSRPAGESGAAPQWSLADSAGVGPVVDPGPLVVSLFEAANDRRATPLERVLLGELERDADTPARAAGETGADWVAAALREAVSSGSAFVAPKRIREIINRWAAAGGRPGVAVAPAAADPEPAPQPANSSREAVRLPRRRNAVKVWQAVVDDLAQLLDANSHARLLADSRISGYRGGVVQVEVDPAAQAKLAAEYRPLLERHLERHIGQPVTVDVVAAVEDSVTPAGAGEDRIEISRADAEQGRQLWQAVLNEIAPLTSADDRARLRGVVPLGQDAEGCIVIGAPTALAARLLQGRCRQPVESALRMLLGDLPAVRVALRDEWLIQDDTRGGRA